MNQSETLLKEIYLKLKKHFTTLKINAHYKYKNQDFELDLVGIRKRKIIAFEFKESPARIVKSRKQLENFEKALKKPVRKFFINPFEIINLNTGRRLSLNEFLTNPENFLDEIYKEENY